MTSLWAALCAESIVLFAAVGTVTNVLRNRLRGGVGSTLDAQ